MAQTRPNGVIVPINSDGYNLAPDLATMGDSSNLVVICPSLAARDALTLYPGRTVWRQDLNVIQVYNGAIWSSVALGDTGWLTTGLTYGNGFTPLSGGGYNGVQYRLMGGICYVGGALNNALTWTGGQAYFALPAGYRPTQKWPGVNCAVEPGGNVLAIAGGSNTSATFSASFPVT